MIRFLSLALIGGFAALVMVNSANAGCDCSTPKTVAKDATLEPTPDATASEPAPQRYSYDPSTTTTAPTQSYRTYSYNPGMDSTNSYRSRSYSNGVRDAASKVLGVYSPFSR
jgi:hypothetical protein